MNVMIELPGGKYYAVPREELKKYSVSQQAFDSELEEKYKTDSTVFSAEVEGQEFRPPRTRNAVLGVRG